MSTTKVGKDTSLQKGGVFFQTFRDLQKQQRALDRQIQKLGKNLLKAASKKAKTSKKRSPYVARMKNDKTLKEAILCVMIPGRKMDMDEVLSIIEREKTYRTRSKGIYTMVNNKLHEMRRKGTIKRSSRGIFILPKTGQRKKVS